MDTQILSMPASTSSLPISSVIKIALVYVNTNRPAFFVSWRLKFRLHMTQSELHFSVGSSAIWSGLEKRFVLFRLISNLFMNMFEIEIRLDKRIVASVSIALILLFRVNLELQHA